MPDDPRPPAAAPGPALTGEEVELLFTLVRRRYGARLTAEQLAGVRQALDTIARQVAALRAVPLDNADAPWPPFVPYRAEP